MKIDWKKRYILIRYVKGDEEFKSEALRIHKNYVRARREKIRKPRSNKLCV